MYKAICEMMLSGHEMQKVKNRCKFDDELAQWEVPPFFLKGKEVQLPKLGLGQAKAVVEAEKENRDIMFEEGEGDAARESNGFGDRVQSRGMRRTGDRNEFRIASNNAKKRGKTSVRQPEQPLEEESGEYSDGQ